VRWVSGTGLANNMRQRLNNMVCLSLMRDAEATSGIPYAVYARIRLDSMFFAPLPPSVLKLALVPGAAVVPDGDAWGGDLNHLGVCDRMLIGRLKAFATDAYGWKAFRRNSSHLSGRVLTSETYQRAILEHANVSIVRVKIAYATLSVDGKARYGEHLSNALDIYGRGLLRDYPAICPCNALPALACNSKGQLVSAHGCKAQATPTSCEGNASKPCLIDWSLGRAQIQTEPMKAADPGQCKLARLCKCCN
jgi:hypothetical protein